MTDSDPWLGDPFDDDVPWADPNIRKEYEAALGKFILLFNELDYHVAAFVRAQLERRGLSALARQVLGEGFGRRLPIFGDLARGDPHLSLVKVERLKSLSEDRNRLAHGHFEQNPFDGRYKLILRKTVEDYPITRVECLAQRMEEVLNRFRDAEAARDFEPVTLEMTAAEVRAIVSLIPFGKVATYARVAMRIEGTSQTGGLRCGRLIRDSKSFDDWPWHRVVRSDGTISPKNARKEEQRRRLRADGVKFKDVWCVDLRACRWDP